MVQGCIETVFIWWSVTSYHKRGEIMHQLELKCTSLNFKETWHDSNISLLNRVRPLPIACFTAAINTFTSEIQVSIT